MDGCPCVPFWVPFPLGMVIGLGYFYFYPQYPTTRPVVSCGVGTLFFLGIK